MIVVGDALEALKLIATNSIDSLVTDPPAGISFMGKDWDNDKGGRDHWIAWMAEVMSECLRVLKPGGHGFVWALPRTSHWTATALENAGFEVRDIVMHVFGSGFPKSLDVSKAIDKAAGADREVVGVHPYAARKPNGTWVGEVYEGGPGMDGPKVTVPATDSAKQWQGWGTALKPASEHWILVRKPLSEKTVAANVLKHGTGAINIDASRIGTEKVEKGGFGRNRKPGSRTMSGGVLKSSPEKLFSSGRFPANFVLSEGEAVEELDRQSGVLKPGGNTQFPGRGAFPIETMKRQHYAETGGASRFFYVAKASKSDRGEGNNHPTVKSSRLMTYLIRMITPPGGTVLDPFAGAGSTGVAALREGFEFIGIERDQEYAAIAEARIKCV